MKSLFATDEGYRSVSHRIRLHLRDFDNRDGQQCCINMSLQCFGAISALGQAITLGLPEVSEHMSQFKNQTSQFGFYTLVVKCAITGLMPGRARLHKNKPWAV